jgi:hypothetical protein
MLAVQWVVSPGGSELDRPFGDLRSQGRDARGPGLVALQPFNALLHEPLLPAPHARLAFAGAAHDLDRARPGSGQQDDPCPPHMFLRAVPVRDDRFQTSTIGGAHIDDDILVIPQTRTRREPRESRFGFVC